MEPLKLLISAVFILLVVACDENGSINRQLEPRENEVWIKNASFVPKVRIVTEGTEVTWINLEDEVHSITSLDRIFDTEIANGERFSFTFKVAGSYQYTSRKHPDMDALIIVE
jgi:plastocyanin